MVGWVILACWLCVQPWARWPAWSAEVSHRLTLLACTVMLGLWQLGRFSPQRLPRAWLAWVAALLVVMLWHLREALTSGDYFTFFVETAVLSNGIATALTSAFGLWALLQWRSLRAVRWFGLALLVANLMVALPQAWRGGWSTGDWHAMNVGGLLGMERFLGTYAVAWLPICLVWSPWLAILPLALILLAHKPLLLFGAVVSCWALLGRRVRTLVIAGGLAAVWWMWPLVLGQKLAQRGLTWWHGLQASAARPFAGWGFDPMTMSDLRQAHGFILPSFHSDWLALSVFAGWVVALWAAWLWWRVVSVVPRTRWASACRGSLLAIGVLALVQGTVSQARIAGLALVLLAWWSLEQRQESSHA